MANPVEPPLTAAASADTADLVAALIHSRQTILPRRLDAPGPDAGQLEMILASASAAPDHGQLTPWRFVIVPELARGRLADVFAASLTERDALATDEQVAQAREKAYRSPLLMLAIGRMEVGDPEIDATERLISAGCAVQNMLLTAHALGFGTALTSGKALKSKALGDLFGLDDSELALCFISIGTAHKRKPARQRPATDAFVSVLSEA